MGTNKSTLKKILNKRGLAWQQWIIYIIYYAPVFNQQRKTFRNVVIVVVMSIFKTISVIMMCAWVRMHKVRHHLFTKKSDKAVWIKTKPFDIEILLRTVCTLSM